MACGVLFLLSAEYSTVMCGVFALRYTSVSEILVPGFGRCLVVPEQDAWARGMAAYVRDGYGAFRQPNFECGCCEMLFLWCVV